jgi:hypothetical protein
MTTINAFHPDYVKTFHPEFLSAIRTESTQHSNGVINGGKSKAAREAKRGKTVNTINLNPKSSFVIDERKRKFLAVTEFHMFSKAGTANTTKKKKKA